MNIDFLNAKLEKRRAENALRQLRITGNMTDLCSNDYLGVVRNRLIEKVLNKEATGRPFLHGSTGSRLLSGNSELAEKVEKDIARFHDCEAALLFNSGYDANVGLLSCVPQKGDTILYDQLSHASIRDGVRLSFARSFSFRHNDLVDLEDKLQSASGNVFVVTESVFSMDGDMCPLPDMVSLCERTGAHLIVDEAHATGVIGNRGEGLVQHLGMNNRCFARIHTFGKALGCHGAAVTGSSVLQQYLVNFSRPFIYTTALPGSSLSAIETTYQLFPQMTEERTKLQELVQEFNAFAEDYKERITVISSTTPVQGIIIPGNDAVKKVAEKLQLNGLDVRPILYPTVPIGMERLRVVLHSFNTSGEIRNLFEQLISN